MFANHLANLPQFAALLGAGVLLLAAFWALYTLITPHDELALIRAGNLAAALMLAGAMLGYALPLGVALARSADFWQLAQSGGVALGVQFAAYLLLRLTQRDLHEAILQDRVSVALWVAAVSLCAGILNAGAQFA